MTPNASLFSLIHPELEPHLPSLQSLQKAYAALSQRYHDNRAHPTQVQIQNQTEAYAYCLARAPSTLSALETVLGIYTENNLFPNDGIHTVLDLGCGPALSYLICKQHLPHMGHFTGVEQNSFMRQIAQTVLAPYRTHITLHATSFEKSVFPPSDLVILSYALNENKKHLTQLMKKTWQATKKVLILLEPGTPEDFKTLEKVRTFLIQNQGFIMAPCGHNNPCPLRQKKDWCHFPQPVQRSTLHQALKLGQLNHETEKYSYLIAVKSAPVAMPPRLIRPPLKRQGHLVCDLCTGQGIQRRVLTKKDPAYALATKKKWGDLFPYSPKLSK